VPRRPVKPNPAKFPMIAGRRSFDVDARPVARPPTSTGAARLHHVPCRSSDAASCRAEQPSACRRPPCAALTS